MLVRFNGHCKRFYSVAEHSVHVSSEIEPDLAMVGLLHDAAEAYLGDVPTPLKRQLRQFKEYELLMERAIGRRFELDADLFSCAELKRADVQLLVDEKSVLMSEEPEAWPFEAPPVKDPHRVVCWSPEKARERFLSRFWELTG
jgi:hypothetical protein